MNFISKVELKYQLEKMGIKVKGNYVKKKDIKKIIQSGTEDTHKFFIVYKDKATSPFKKDSGEELVLDGFVSEEEAKKNLSKWKKEYDAYIVNYDPLKKLIKATKDTTGVPLLKNHNKFYCTFCGETGKL